MSNNMVSSNRFIIIAQGDLRTGLREVIGMENDEAQRRWAGYMFQQCIEKSLKAIIYCIDDSKFMPSHTVSDLFDIVERFNILPLTDINFDSIAQLDKDFTKFRYPDDLEDIPYDRIMIYKDLAEYIFNSAKEYISNFIPKYLQVFPKFDDDEIVNKLSHKKWVDVSHSNDGMPSFEFIDDKTQNVYKVFINYENHDLRIRTWLNNKRFRLLKNGEEISLQNSFDYILHDFKEELRKNQSIPNGGR